VAEKLRQAIHAHRLTSLSNDCYVIPRTEPGEQAGPNLAVFDVREVHDAKCGGGPATDRLRMFGMRINVVTGAIWSDARSSTGDYLRLR